MFIGICGGLCAGKASVAAYLIKQHNFQLITLDRHAGTPSVEKSASHASLPSSSSPSLSLHSTSHSALRFADVETLLDHATLHWQTNFVTTSIWSQSILSALRRRPFFILLSIDAPISIRWQRFRDRCIRASLPPPSLEQFVLRNDEHQYDATSGLAALATTAQIRLLNSTSSLDSLWDALDKLNLPDPARIRPTWDQYFMTLASLAARRSNCMRRPVGSPCLTCSVKIIQVGISEVVYSQGYYMDTKTAAMFKEAGVHMRQFIPEGLVNLSDTPLHITAV
ncbi:Deoxycytidine monophosphate (dCMP) deaminase [Taxawa tesnikishii (nom. ined.)]|nr:Deoxycytidine monophosphate (dCMP) deaminase [Dothideales sp. JES 119]